MRIRGERGGGKEERERGGGGDVTLDRRARENLLQGQESPVEKKGVRADRRTFSHHSNQAAPVKLPTNTYLVEATMSGVPVAISRESTDCTAKENVICNHTELRRACAQQGNNSGAPPGLPNLVVYAWVGRHNTWVPPEYIKHPPWPGIQSPFVVRCEHQILFLQVMSLDI